jgi:hypothetical protein
LSSEDEQRFRTGAVAAALLYRGTKATPRDAWKWVAGHLNRENVWRPKSGSFTPKTIENWSTKGACSENLIGGMKALANAFSSRTAPTHVAEAALLTAVSFAPTKNSKSEL